MTVWSNECAFSSKCPQITLGTWWLGSQHVAWDVGIRPLPVVSDAWRISVSFSILTHFAFSLPRKTREQGPRLGRSTSTLFLKRQVVIFHIWPRLVPAPPLNWPLFHPLRLWGIHWSWTIQRSCLSLWNQSAPFWTDGKTLTKSWHWLAAHSTLNMEYYSATIWILTTYIWPGERLW